ncbi:MAG: DUF4249 domain-containing protein [Bacteroidia bacterium]|nr:DUF4249 domain-containing protein [Bacteroidia bacterium]
MRRFIYLLLIATLTQACETNVNVPLPPHTSRLVLNSFLSAGDSVRLFLTRSYGPLERVTIQDLLIEDATVRFWIDDVEMTTVDFRDSIVDPFFGERSAYYVGRNGVPAAGSRVRVEVTHPDYEMASGETTLPSSARMIKAELIQNAYRQSIGNNDTYTQSILRVTFEDPNSESNYFRIDRAYFTFRDPDFPTQVQGGALSVIGPAVPTSDGGFEATGSFGTDENGSGGTVVIDFLCEMPNAFSPASEWKEVLLDSLYVSSETANEDYALYQEKLTLQQQNSGGGIQLSPSEPVELYNNIDGGYGVIGGYVLRADTLAF